MNRKANRYKTYNYFSSGYYFVTICTKDRLSFFGKIEDGKMILNECGKIVRERWLWLQDQYNYIKYGEHAIMPNHFHGILIIDTVGTGRDLSLQKIKPLSELIGAFKATSSKLIHQTGLNEFRWQRSFYDHIIRNESSLNNIRDYIIKNSLNWDTDKNNLQFNP